MSVVESRLSPVLVPMITGDSLNVLLPLAAASCGRV
jgi:hypothetical protein